MLRHHLELRFVYFYNRPVSSGVKFQILRSLGILKWNQKSGNQCWGKLENVILLRVNHQKAPPLLSLLSLRTVEDHLPTAFNNRNPQEAVEPQAPRLWVKDKRKLKLQQRAAKMFSLIQESPVLTTSPASNKPLQLRHGSEVGGRSTHWGSGQAAARPPKHKCPQWLSPSSGNQLCAPNVEERGISCLQNSEI